MLAANSRSFRLHIGAIEGHDFGKSSLLNVTPDQKVSIVSEIAGTSSDPAEMPMDEEGAWGPYQEQQLAQLRSCRTPALVAKERADLQQRLAEC